MDEQQLQIEVRRVLGEYLSALDQAGAPYTPDYGAWQTQAAIIATAAVSVYYAQGAPQPLSQGVDEAATLATQIQQSSLVAGVPDAVDEQISAVLVAGGIVAVSALLSPSAVAWAALISAVAANVFLWAASAGLAAAAVYAGMTKKTWKARRDDKTRVSHRIANGQTVPIGTAFDVGGFKLRYPHDPFGPPQETYNCRCTVRYGR